MIHFTKIRKDSHRITPNMEQGAWICYRLKLIGNSQKALAKQIGVSQQMVQQVAYGLKTSQRVQKAIANSLGYNTWADLIANSRRVAA